MPLIFLSNQLFPKGGCVERVNPAL